MKIAFCLYKYFPYGGLQRDFLRIALACKNRGHSIRVYTASWQGEQPDNIHIIIVPAKGLTNHSKNKTYHQWVMKDLATNPVNVVVGFNKMPNLDIYYAADVCYLESVDQNKKTILYRLSSRYRHYAKFEKAVFAKQSKTKLLMLTEQQISAFKKYYQTPQQRFYILPPGIESSRKYHALSAQIAADFRQKHQISADIKIILQVGSDFKRKGVDRSLKAIAALPDSLKQKIRYLVIGQDDPTTYLKMADRLNIKNCVQFYAGRDDVADFLFAADLLLHPAYSESAGIVLLEALISGLPVITTVVCGYAQHIQQATAGIIINQPFQQESLNLALYKALSDSEQLTQWSHNAISYSNGADLYSLAEKAADIIVEAGND